jgi:hypothetical protein
MIRLTSRVVQPPTSGVPATKKSVFQVSAVWARGTVFSLAGAKPGSASVN